MSALGQERTSPVTKPMSLYPRKRTSSDGTGMSALCQKRTNAPQQKSRYSITASARASKVGGIALRRLLPAMPLMPLELLDADQYAERSLHLSVSELEVP